MTRALTTAMSYWNHRFVPAATVEFFAEQIARSGVVDYFHTSDVLSNCWPRHAWTEQNTPAAQLLPDMNSVYDPWVVTGLALSAQPSLGAWLGVTAFRPGPAELIRTMMTLASIGNGPVVCHIGAGEAYNVVPFGYRRSEGLGRLEEQLQLMKLLWERDTPFDFDGRYWSYKGAFAGSAREARPKFYAMGAGPRIMDIAARLADGWTTYVPGGFSTPEAYAAAVKEMRQRLESYGRDPDGFGFGLCFGVMMHEDPEAIDRALDNALVRWFASTVGRMDQSKWRAEGLEPVYPDEWNYALHMLPEAVSESEFKTVIERFDRRYARRSFTCGTTKEVAEVARAYVDAGATNVQASHLIGLSQPIEETAATMERTLELYRILKSG